MSSSTSNKTNDLLVQQLQAAEAKGGPVQAWFRLRSGDSAQPAASPEQTEKLAHQIVERAKNRVGQSVDALNVQRQLGTFTVLAQPALLKEIMNQPEIDFAGATQVSEFGLIKPVKSQPVKLQTPTRKKRRTK